MLKHLSALAALGALAACASTPESSSTPTSPVMAGNAPSSGSPVASATVMNVAGSTHWTSEERLLPQQPILALVPTAGGNVDQPTGLWMTCNPDSGAIKARIGRQDASRVGQTAVYTMRMGAQALPVPGKFEAGTGGSTFVFDWDSMGLRSVAQLDMVSFASDKGEVEWAFVRDPAAAVNAKYVGSLKDMGRASQDFLNYCNPK